MGFITIEGILRGGTRAVNYSMLSSLQRQPRLPPKVQSFVWKVTGCIPVSLPEPTYDSTRWMISKKKKP